MKKLKVAIIGQGRSGRDIHGLYFKSKDNENYEVAAIVEKDEFRRTNALKEFPGCVAFEDYTSLFDLKDIDIVVNASYSEMHYSITKDLLNHGFNVLVEKPFGRNYYECSDLIKTAKENNVVLAVFQQSFFAPHYVEAKKMADSGKLGDIKQISIHYNGFSRRWDWQTLQARLAGGLYNTGPHPVGLALGFLGFDDNTRIEFSKLGSGLTSGDSDDYAKIILTAPGKPVVDVEVSSLDAFSDFNIKIQGSRGTYSCTVVDYKYKYIVDGENPERPVQYEFIKDEKGLPLYCSEELVCHEDSGKYDGEIFEVGSREFYKMLYNTLVNGDELLIKPEDMAKIVNVIDSVHTQNPMEKKYF